MIIAIDFDGTVVTHEYPKVGRSVGAEKVLKAIVEKGHKLILNTMRSHKGNDTLADAERWFKDNGIELYGANENPSQKEWTDSPKVYANMYIDDSALGCPKKVIDGKFVVVDWEVVEAMLKNYGII